MPVNDTSDLTSYQRAAIVAVALARQRRLKTTDVMALTGLKRSTAFKLLSHLASLPELPLFQDAEGFWQVRQVSVNNLRAQLEAEIRDRQELLSDLKRDWRGS